MSHKLSLPQLSPPPMSRRQLLLSAAGGFGYLALAGLCAEAAAAEAARTASALVAGTDVPHRKTGPKGYESPLAPKTPPLPVKAKRVIFLFMEGGPSHLDTFDYKPKLQSDNGKDAKGGKLLASPFKFARAGRSGLYMSELFPNLARHADELCMLNGMYTDNPAHPQATLQLHTGSAQFVRPSLGSWVLYGLGTLNQNLPGFITINPPGGVGGAQNYGSAFLPAAFQGTRLDRSGEMADLGNESVPQVLQRRQLDLVQSMNHTLEARSGAPDQIEGVIQSLELGFRMQSAVPDLMDISKESPATLALYGIGTGGPGGGRGQGGGGGGANDGFARQCLMARRFAQAGVRFIEVAHNGWDNHSNLHQAMTRNAASTDRAIAGLLADLKAHGMLQDTLVIWGGEFGRTPAGQNTDGRNHNNRGFTMWLAGGGAKGGTAYGQTDDYGAQAVGDDKMHVHDLHATVLALLGLDHERLTYNYAGRDFRLTDVHGRIVKEVIA